MASVSIFSKNLFPCDCSWYGRNIRGCNFQEAGLAGRRRVSRRVATTLHQIQNRGPYRRVYLQSRDGMSANRSFHLGFSSNERPRRESGCALVCASRTRPFCPREISRRRTSWKIAHLGESLRDGSAWKITRHFPSSPSSATVEMIGLVFVNPFEYRLVDEALSPISLREKVVPCRMLFFHVDFQQTTRDNSTNPEHLFRNSFAYRMSRYQSPRDFESHFPTAADDPRIRLDCAVRGWAWATTWFLH